MTIVTRVGGRGNAYPGDGTRDGGGQGGLRTELAFGSSHRVRRVKIDWDRLREGPPKPSTVRKKSMPKKKTAPVLRN